MLTINSQPSQQWSYFILNPNSIIRNDYCELGNDFVKFLSDSKINYTTD